MWYCVILFTVFYPSFPYLKVYFNPFLSGPMNIENHAEHIRDLLSRHAPQDQRRLLHDLLTTIPEQEEPSLTKSDDYLCTFEHLLFSAIFPHVGNPKPPWNNGITRRRLAWQWIMDQLSEAIGR